jgi:hypothetical protein
MSLEQLQIEYLNVEIEKLRLEVAALKTRDRWSVFLSRWVPTLTFVFTVGGIVGALVQFYMQRLDTEAQHSESQIALAVQHGEAEKNRLEQAKRDHARTFFESQVQHYVRASQAAATIATSSDAAKVKQAEEEFWTLYWGPMCIVEDVLPESNSDSVDENRRDSATPVAKAMIGFGNYLKSHEKLAERSCPEMCNLSLALANTMREAASNSYAIKSASIRNEYK